MALRKATFRVRGVSTEKNAASQSSATLTEKFQVSGALRHLEIRSWPPSSPVAFCAGTWNSMNDTPTTAALTNSAMKPGTSAGSAEPTASPMEPTSIGRRTPTRSDRRPAATAQSIGSSAYSASSTPTTAVDAPRRNASSDTVTRLPVRTM